MARRSATVERFYVCPVCAPTRAGLMTGRYHYRTGVVDTWVARALMDPQETTIAERVNRVRRRLRQRLRKARVSSMVRVF